MKHDDTPRSHESTHKGPEPRTWFGSPLNYIPIEHAATNSSLALSPVASEEWQRKAPRSRSPEHDSLKPWPLYPVTAM